MSSCWVKFTSVDTKVRGIHNILNNMNKRYQEHEMLENSKNSPAPKYYQWYLDLEFIVDNTYSREDIVLGRLLERLAVYAKV